MVTSAKNISKTSSHELADKMAANLAAKMAIPINLSIIAPQTLQNRPGTTTATKPLPTSETEQKPKAFDKFDCQIFVHNQQYKNSVYWNNLTETEKIKLFQTKKNLTSEEIEEHRETIIQIIRDEYEKYFNGLNKKTMELIKSANIPKIFRNKRATDFKITSRNEIATQCMKAIRNNSGFYIYGECGTGKTLLASIIQNERAQLLKSSMFICATDIFQELNPYNGNQDEAMNKRRIIKNTPCLIIDDLGAEKATDWTKQTLFDILNYRYNEELQTIITSNFSLEELKKRLSEYEGARIIRRIKEMCEVIELKNYK